MPNISPEAELLIRVAEQGFFPYLSADAKQTVVLLLRSMFLVDRYLDTLPVVLKEQSEKEVFFCLQHKDHPLDEAIKGNTRDSLLDLKAILLSL